MEYLDGVTLSDKMKAEGRLPAQQLLSMLRPLMEDIGKLHASASSTATSARTTSCGCRDNTLKLLDFGWRALDGGRQVHERAAQARALLPWSSIRRADRGPGRTYIPCARRYITASPARATSAVERLEGDALVPPTALGAELTPREETALLWGLAVQPTRRPQNIELLIGQLCPAPPKKPVKRKKPEKPGGAGKVKAGKVSAKRIIGLAAAAIVLVVALVLIFGEGKEPSYGSPAYEPAAASPPPPPHPRPSRRRPSPPWTASPTAWSTRATATTWSG